MPVGYIGTDVGCCSICKEPSWFDTCDNCNERTSTPPPSVHFQEKPWTLGCKSKKEEIVSEEKKEQVNHPKHYNVGKFEVIDVIEDWQLDFHLGNVVKYVSRAGRKSDDTELQDLNKAMWYLKRRIELLEKKDV